MSHQREFREGGGNLPERGARLDSPTLFARWSRPKMPEPTGGPGCPIFRLNQSLFERSQASEREALLRKKAPHSSG